MTPQETTALQDLLHQLTQVRGIVKDPDADALIGRAVAQQPDAAYLLIQRAMLLEQALTSAKATIAQLESQLEQERSRAAGSGDPGRAGGSFLDSATAWGRSAISRPRQAMSPSAHAPSAPGQMPMEQQAPMQGAAPAGRSGFLGGGGGSFLGSMAATAAGVAGGAFLFQGIGSLLGNHGQGSGLLGQQGMSGMAPDSSSLAGKDAATENAASSDTLGSADNAVENDAGLGDAGLSNADYSDAGGFDGFDDGDDDMNSI
jgi:hypothetical protein